jgi:hypothetical protein
LGTIFYSGANDIVRKWKLWNYFSQMNFSNHFPLEQFALRCYLKTCEKH